MSEKHKWVDPEKAFVVHPDMGRALRDYRPDGDSLGEVFEWRDQMASSGEEYWNTDHDDEMRETAENRSKDAGIITSGWRFPSRKKRR